MRIVFMGTPDFSVPTLEAMIEGGHEVAAVVCQPDKPKGRGGVMQPPAVKAFALKHGIMVHQPKRVRAEEFIEILKELNPDVIVVIAFGQILPKAVLEIPRYGCINVHASLLPKLRGAAPVQWAILNGETKTGVTTMYMDEGLDTGDMLMKEEIPIERDETGGSLHDKLASLGGGLLLRTLKALEDGTAVREKQQNAPSDYAKMLNKAQGKIDFTKEAAEIERLIRGLNPWPSAYTYLDGKTLKIWKVLVIPEEYEGCPGEIVAVTKNTIVVKTGNGALSLLELQLEGRKRMETEVFLRGYSVKAGTRL